MTSHTFHKAIEEALDHYHDLDRLNHSRLTELKVVQARMVVPGPLLTSVARGLAVRSLLDHAIEELEKHLPEAARFIRLRFCQQKQMQLVGEELGWADAKLFRLRKNAIAALVAGIGSLELASHTWNVQQHASLRHIPRLDQGYLVGIEETAERLRRELRLALLPRRQPIVVTGLGGSGKTALMADTLYQWLTLEKPPVSQILWLSLERVRGVTGGEGLPTSGLLEHLLRQLEEQGALPTIKSQTPVTHLRLLVSAWGMRVAPPILVLDGVETEEEQQLTHLLCEKLLPVALLLITCRRTLPLGHARIIGVPELSLDSATALLQGERERLGFSPFSEEEAQHLYAYVGGNPRALQFVAGLGMLAPEEVLRSLHHADSLALPLYEAIHEHLWQRLSDMARQLLLQLVPLPASGVPLKGLLIGQPKAADTLAGEEAIRHALVELSHLHLVQTLASPTPLYRLHPLTRLFLEQKIGMVGSHGTDDAG